MMTITKDMLDDYRTCLHNEERCGATIEKYMHDLTDFAVWLGERELTKEQTATWKNVLAQSGIKPETVNGKLSALNGFLSHLDLLVCRVKLLKVQRKLFRDQSRELSRQEYDLLVAKAKELGKHRLALLLETICGTGIRVSEVRYITVEAAEQGRAEISLKGKIRVILLPGKLCRKLKKLAKKLGITTGEIFLTRTGRRLGRTQIWREMKALCKKAGVEESKVFPHNLRHLFARTYYRASRDIVRLADILGHSSVETTRIYLIGTGLEHVREMERLGLIS